MGLSPRAAFKEIVLNQYLHFIFIACLLQEPTSQIRIINRILVGPCFPSIWDIFSSNLYEYSIVSF